MGRIRYVRTEVDTKSPERQDLCAKISVNVPPRRLPRQCASTHPKPITLGSMLPINPLFRGHLPRVGLGHH